MSETTALLHGDGGGHTWRDIEDVGVGVVVMSRY